MNVKSVKSVSNMYSSTIGSRLIPLSTHNMSGYRVFHYPHP